MEKKNVMDMVNNMLGKGNDVVELSMDELENVTGGVITEDEASLAL